MTSLRTGFTTGTCAAAAAKASAKYLLGEIVHMCEIRLPNGGYAVLPVEHLGNGTFSVKKDAGDDPDVTHGLCICAEVALTNAPDGRVEFIAGEGVGHVTLPGLKIPPGEPAINPVPRSMIRDAVQSVLGDAGVRVTISIPGGDVVARKTFNPRLGIVGGLSILGTTGIVKPMSEDAIKDSLTAELGVKAASGRKALVYAFGETGEQQLRQACGLPADACIQVSNYVGFMIEQAVNAGIEKILVGGHAGKMIKLAAGIMQTHSRTADGRMETLCAYAALAGAPLELLRAVMACKTTEAAMRILTDNGLHGVWENLAQAAAGKCTLYARGTIQVQAVMLDQQGRILGQSRGVSTLIKEMIAWER